MILRWGIGLGLSVLAHLGAAAALVRVVEPQPVSDQPLPETQMQLDAWSVERSRAAEWTPDSTEATPGDTSGAALDAGGIPQLRADALTADPVAMPAVNAPGETLAALTGIADALTEEIAKAQLAAPLDQPVVTLATVAAIAADVSVTRAPTELAPVVIPTAMAAAQGMAVTESVPPSPPQADMLPEAASPAQTAPSAEPEVTRSKATLAFSGGGDGTVDPISLAAFQSFMQPGDLGGAASDVRDGIAGLLANVPCARMQVQFLPETNSLQVSGHVPEEGLRAPVVAALQAQMGADITVSDNLLILPRPQCGALGGIAGVGLPQSTDQITNPLLVGEDAHAAVFGFVKDQALVLDLEGADYDAYVYVDYFDAGGNVVHLAPNEHTPLELVGAMAPFRIGSEAEMEPGTPGLFIRIGPPYGQEIVAAFASSVPLYEGTRPLSEPAAPYLEWLGERVATARAANPDFRGEWVYFFVSTAAE